MNFRTRSGCYHNCGKPSRLPKSHFCSDKCASEWAETMIEGNGDEWCSFCQVWINDNAQHKDSCPNKDTEIPY